MLVSKDAKFVQGGEPCPSLGEFANLRKHKRGKALPLSERYLDKVRLDIIYGNLISKLGFCFALLLIDHATKYIWVYGLKNLQSDCMIDAFEQFRADTGCMPKELCYNCDQKLLGGETRCWI